MNHRLQPFHLQMRKITELLSYSPQPCCPHCVPRAHIHSNSGSLECHQEPDWGSRVPISDQACPERLFLWWLSQLLDFSHSLASHFMEWATYKNILYVEIFKALSYFSQRESSNKSLRTLFCSIEEQKIPFIKHLLLGTVLGTVRRAFIKFSLWA